MGTEHGQLYMHELVSTTQHRHKASVLVDDHACVHPHRLSSPHMLTMSLPLHCPKVRLNQGPACLHGSSALWARKPKSAERACSA
eukprot:scaffold175510_cov20-Tisochrysis_lutea.AAC.1